MSALVGALRAMLSLDSTAFVDGAKRAQDRSSQLEARLQRLGGRMQAIGAAMSAVGVGIGLAIKGQLDAADQLDEASQKFGVPIEQLSRLKYAAELSGVQFDTLGASLRVMSRGMVQDAEKFTAIGVAVRDSAGNMRSTEAVLQDVADVFARMPDGAEKTALAMQLFGRSGTDMILMLNAGKTGLQQMADEATAMGLVIDAKTGAAAGRFNENLDRLRATMNGLVVQIAAALAPTLERLSEIALAIAEKFRNLSPETQTLMANMALFGLALGPLILGLGVVVSSITAVAGALKAVAALFLTNPIVLAGVAIAGAAWLIYENWDGIVAFFEQLWADVKAIFTETWESIKRTVIGAVHSVMLKFDEIVAKIQTIIDKAKSLGTAIASALNVDAESAAAMEAFEENYGMTYEDGAAVGAAIADGVADGTINGVQNRKADIRDAFGQVTGLALEEFEINSPSRVFSRIGAQLMAGLGVGVRDNMDAATVPMADVADRMTEAADQFKGAWGSAFTSLVTGSQSLRGALSQLASSMASTFANNAFDALWSGGGSGNGLGALVGSVFGFAKGGVFDTGRVQAFANGGVVNGATAFGMAGGLGVMGEAGPEAIMPLTRGANGKLGVEAHGGGGGVMRLIIEENPMFAARVQTEARGVAVEVVQAGIEQYDSDVLPQRVGDISGDPRVRGK